MTGQPCAAVTEINLGAPCGTPSVVKVVARCAHGHDRAGWTCEEHLRQMRRSLTYCYACFIASHACRVFVASVEAVTDVS